MNMSANSGGAGPGELVLICYHSPCIDGYTSAWVTAKHYVNQEQRVVLMPARYNDDYYGEVLEACVQFQFKEILFVDFSVPVNWLKSYHAAAPEMGIVVLDHHKTAFEMYARETGVEVGYIEPDARARFTGQAFGIPHCDLFIMLENSMCGAQVCWRYFNTNTPEPKLLRYVGDYDLWKYEYGDETRYMNQHLRSMEQTLPIWDELVKCADNDYSLQIMLTHGKQLHDEHMRNVEQYAEHAQPVIFQGHLGYFAACPSKYASDVGNIVAKKCNSFCLMSPRPWDPDPKHKDTSWGLRSVGDYDVSEMAKLMGGGGHRNAAGFTMENSESIEFYKQLVNSMDDEGAPV